MDFYFYCAMNENPNYYAVIPASVRYSDIPPNAKLLYGEITALCSKEGFCWASNQYFADLYKVQPTTISEWIKILNDNDFIKIETDGTHRKLWLREKPKAASGKAEGYPSGKAEHSNTSSITTMNSLKGGEAHGNPDVNALMASFKASSDFLDGSEKENRRFAWLLLQKIGKVAGVGAAKDGVLYLIEAARKSKFHSKNATSMKYIYYHAAAIAEDAKRSGNQVAVIR